MSNLKINSNSPKIAVKQFSPISLYLDMVNKNKLITGQNRGAGHE